jgi:hypothetical protein
MYIARGSCHWRVVPVTGALGQINLGWAWLLAGLFPTLSHPPPNYKPNKALNMADAQSEFVAGVQSESPILRCAK